MITVSVHGYGGAYAADVNGHAGYAEHGRDIVCAGVTALAAALNGFAEKETVRVENGCYHAVIDAKNALAVRMFENGVREIERMYPAHVKFIKQEDF